MIVCTRACDGLVKNSLPKDKRNSFAIRRLVEICELMQLDPATAEQPVEAFIVAATDVQSPKLAQAFEAALARKHDDARVIFISKAKKPTKYTTEFPGIDASLIAPKAQQLQDAIFKFVAELSEKPRVQSAGDVAGQLKPREAKLSFEEIAESAIPEGSSDVDLLLDDEDEEEEAQGIQELPVVEEEAQEVESSDTEPELVKRMKNAQQVADLSQLFKETTAESILRDLAKDNAQYSVLESKISQLKEEIQNIMLDNNLSDNDKLEKVRTISYDKRYYNLQSNTLIEQYVTEIIDCLIKTTNDVLNQKLERINLSLSKAAQYGEGAMNFGRLAGINEERANIVMELYTLDNEIKQLATEAADVLIKLSSDMGASMSEVSGSDRIDTIINMQGTIMIDADAFSTVLKVVSLAKETTEFSEKCVRAVKQVIEKHNALVRVDKELIAVQNQMIKYMRENNVENTVIANTLLKQSLRVFTGSEGSGRSIIPYLLSDYKQMQSSNVLLIDLTGTCKWERYGISSVTLDDYRNNRYQERFLRVQGKCETPEDAQTLSAILTRAADFYRVINLVLNMEQTQVFDILCADIKCINFITDTKYDRMLAVKNFVPNVTYENVAKRIIVNDCSIPASEAISFFELATNLDTQILTIDHVHQLELASFRKINPVNIDAVQSALKDVSKYA